MQSSISGKPRSRPTISLVAAEAGVAAATVSGILNYRSDCYASEETRQRVFRAARRLGYRPSPMTRAHHGKAAASIGLVIGSFDVIETSMRIFGAVQRTASAGGYMTMIGCHRNDPKLEEEAIGWLLDRYVDGIVVYPTEAGPHQQLRRLVDEDFPVVTIDGAERLDFQTDDVSINYYQAGRLQARHLVEIGRRRIGLINTVERCYVNDEKIRGLEEGLAEAGLSLVVRMNLPAAAHTNLHWEISEFDQIRTFLQQHAGELDALASVGDLLAMATISRALQLGIKIPEDLAIVGCDGIVAGEQLVPSLSTTAQSPERVGELSFEILQQRIGQRRQGGAFCREAVSPHLVVRASTSGGSSSCGSLQQATVPASATRNS